MTLVTELKRLKIGDVIANPLMKDYTTYKVGGQALALVSPTDVNDLISTLKYLKANKLKYKILGNGSNLIFSDRYDGVIIKLDEFDNLYIKDNQITVGAGYSLEHLAIKVSRMGLSGLEFACGIPGSVGGAIFMNAGAYQSDMGYVVLQIKVLTPDYEIKTLYNADLNFHYRTSFLKEHPDYICLEVKLGLTKGSKEDIMSVVNDRKERRLASQPLEYPSAGSVFRNPEGHYAGQLIEAVGLKGYRLGDAMISTKHANFIINVGQASSADIKALIALVQTKVKAQYGITLKLEQEIVD